MKLTIIKDGRKREYDIDFFSYIPTTKELIYKPIGLSIIKLTETKWDKIEVDR